MEAEGVQTGKKYTDTGTCTWWCHWCGGVVWCGVELVCRNTHNGGEQGLRGHAADIKQHGR